MSPEAAIRQRRSQVGLGHDHRGGNGDHDAHDDEIPERRRQRALVHVPSAHHGHRELHDLGGLKTDEADVQPALRTLADVTGDGDHDQQQDSDDVGDRCEQAQILWGRQPSERQHGGHRDRDIRQMMLDHFQVLSGGAVDHQNADANDDREHAGQRPVQPERPQGAPAGGERAARSRGGEFIKNHSFLSGNK